MARIWPFTVILILFFLAPLYAQQLQFQEIKVRPAGGFEFSFLVLPQQEKQTIIDPSGVGLIALINQALIQAKAMEVAANPAVWEQMSSRRVENLDHKTKYRLRTIFSGLAIQAYMNGQIEKEKVLSARVLCWGLNSGHPRYTNLDWMLGEFLQVYGPHYIVQVKTPTKHVQANLSYVRTQFAALAMLRNFNHSISYMRQQRTQRPWAPLLNPDLVLKKFNELSF